VPVAHRPHVGHDGGIEPITPSPPRPLRRTLLSQSWLDVTMLHWAADADAVQRVIPAGTRPDTLDGTTYVGLIGFRMHRLGLGTGPAVPYVGTFLETNVRLYTVDTEGRRGVFFCTLDASRLAAVVGGQVGARVNYVWARMRFRRDGDALTYESRRRRPWSAARSRMRVRVGPVIPEPTELEQFLTARWGLHTRWYGRTLYLPNGHASWPLHRAELLELDEDPRTGLVASAGFSAAGSPASVLHSPGVEVRFGPGTFLR
jgi:uncharacterized protein YqjF (DUF2071 family)